MAGFFSKKILTNYTSDSIDAGFYQYGPSLTTGGVLTSSKVMLIDHISVSLHPPFQAITKEFNWFTLQPYSAIEANLNIVAPPQKFILSPNEPHKYNIMFVDDDCYAELKTVIQSILSSWAVFRENSGSKQNQEEIFNNFCQEPMTIELNDILRKLCYWQAGMYKIELCVTSKEGVFTTIKKFHLNDEDVDSLKNNSVNIISTICNQPSATFHAAKPKLTDA